MTQNEQAIARGSFRRAVRVRRPNRAKREGKRTPSASTQRWAQEEFGLLEGHAARSKCVVRLAALAAMNPAGTVTATFERDAERQAAYGQLANDNLSVESLGEAAHRASARRAAAYPHVYIPIDGTSLSITDRAESKGTGVVGTREHRGRGVQVMNATVVAPNKTPIGMAAQQWWVRTGPPVKHLKHRRVADKETHHWLDAIDHIATIFAQEAPDCEPRIVCDRGADAGVVLQRISASGMKAIVRAAHDRRLRRDSRITYLWNTMRRSRLIAEFELPVPAGPGRAARVAKMSVRAGTMRLELRNRRRNGYKRTHVMINVVYVLEHGAPRGIARIEWMLHTTLPIQTAADVMEVVHGYEIRWSIEEFHRTWKSGLCQVENTQLRSIDRVKKWATLHASIAMRAQRLKHLSRQSEDVPATIEFTRDEIDAVIILYEPHGLKVGHSTPTLRELVYWIAEMGGYTGKSSGGPPGQIVISRGLAKIEPAAKALAAVRKKKS